MTLLITNRKAIKNNYPKISLIKLVFFKEKAKSLIFLRLTLTSKYI